MTLNYQSLFNTHLESQEIFRFLTSYQEHQDTSFPSSFKKVYIHSKVVSFSDSGAWVNWIELYNFMNENHRQTFEEFWKFNHGKSTTVIDVFSTWMNTWVEKLTEGWVNEDWHCWGAAVLKNSKGYEKHLLIWDSNAENVTENLNFLHSDQFLLGTQVKLLKFIKAKEWVDEVWYEGIMQTGQNNQCLQLIMNWVHQMTSMKDVGFLKEKVTGLGFRRVRCS